MKAPEARRQELQKAFAVFDQAGTAVTDMNRMQDEQEENERTD